MARERCHITNGIDSKDFIVTSPLYFGEVVWEAFVGKGT